MVKYQSKTEEVMKKYMLAALTVFMLGAAPFAAHAAEQDVAKITCKDFPG